MKSFFIWLIAVIIGGMSGFGVSYLLGLNLYLTVGVGIILGSSAGVTINIHRERDDELPVDELSQEFNSEAGKPEKINQKVS